MGRNLPRFGDTGSCGTFRGGQVDVAAMGKCLDLRMLSVILISHFPQTALTGMFCFELTTGLTHRWLLYYSLAPTLLRLVSLQSICWPSTFITLRYLGNIDILFAWIVVATTTACSRSVQIWVTSNVPEISARTLKPAAIVLASGSKDPRGGKDTLDPRNRESYDKNRRKSRQAAHVLLRERYWDWNYVISAVWIRVGILYIVTTAYLICHRHL